MDRSPPGDPVELGVEVMPLDGEKLDELLSGLVDGELTEVERKLVEEAARSDASIQQRILALRQQVQEVAELGQLLSAPPHGERKPAGRLSLAERVISQARQQANQLGLPADHHVYEAKSLADHSPTSVATRSTNWNSRILLAGTAASAAAILLAVGFAWRADWGRGSQLANSGTQSTSVPGVVASPTETWPTETSPTPEAGTRVVGQFGNVAYVLVVDVQITAEGLRKRVLDDVLAAAGIPRAEPVLANRNILAALDQSRMIVNPRAKPAQQIYLTVIRADMRDIDAALQNIWKDNQHFPNVSLNVAIDARAALVREILNSTGGRFSLSESFAVPLAAEASSPQLATASPFPGDTDGVRYISSNRRADGWGGSDALAAVPSDRLSTILLVTHLVE